LLSRVKSVYPLTDRNSTLSINKDENITFIDLSSKPADTPVSVIVLEIEDKLQVSPQVVDQDENGEILLNYLTASTKGNASTRYNRRGGFHISKWKGPEDSVEWMINIDRPGKFRLSLEYSANIEWEGKKYEIKAGDQFLENPVISTTGLFEYYEFPAGYIDFPESGQYSLKINPAVNDTTYLMYLKDIKLIPVETIKREGWGS
jgi:alpha-L-fucosidase